MAFAPESAAATKHTLTVPFHSQNVLVYPRKRLFAKGGGLNLPDPRKHQYYTFTTRIDDTYQSILSALDVVQQRPDVDSLSIHIEDLLDDIVWERLRFLLEQQDRPWSLHISFSFCSTNVGQRAIDHSSLRRTFSVLHAVRYISLDANIQSPYAKALLDIFTCFPRFRNLQCLNLINWPISNLVDLEGIFDFPFSGQVQGISLDGLNETEMLALASSSTLARRIHTVAKCPDLFEDDHSIAFDAFATWPLLKTVHLELAHFCDNDLTPFTSLFQWFGSPSCIVTELLVTVDWEGQLFMLLDVLPKMKLLKKLSLGIYGQDDSDYVERANYPECFFDALLQTTSVETVHMAEENRFDAPLCEKALNFQLASRPRLFVVQLLLDRQAEPENDETGIEKIHHVSLVHQTLLNFQRSKRSSSFPLSAWALVLEKLGSAFDCPSTVVHAVGVDAQFHVLQELLSEPHRLLVNHAVDVDAQFRVLRERLAESRRLVDPPVAAAAVAVACVAKSAVGAGNMQRTKKSPRNRKKKTSRYRWRLYPSNRATH